MTRTRTVLTALACTSVLALGACSGDDPEPKFAPTPTVSPSSSSPTTPPPSGPVEPTMPAAADGTDAAAAEAFVEYYWDVVDYAQRSGDLDSLRMLGDTKCEACNRGIDYLAQVFQHDGEVAGGAGTVEISKSAILGGGQPGAVVRFILTTSPQHVTYPGTRKDERYPGGHSTINALLSRKAGGWLVSSWSVEQ